MMEKDWLLQSLYSVFEENPNFDLNQEKIESLGKVIENTLHEFATLLLGSLKANSMEMLEEHRLFKLEFEARLQRRWSKPINLLETLVVISSESGESCYITCLEKAREEKNLVFEVLVKIHARACQISYEILCLLRGGFADGAMSRWRTLHELSVLAFFISQNSNEVAKMYLEYEYIERYYEMLEYIRHAPRLGYEALTNDEVNNLTDIKNKLVSMYGSDYEKPFGWTKNVLPKKDRNFKGIEENIQFDHLRPYYKLACNYVHLGPKASSYSLGVMKESKILLAGASNYGLADPGQNTCLSLTQITTCLLTVYPSYERLVVAKVMSLLVDEISNSFIEVQKNIEDEDLGVEYED
ncbi:DUF5677 domain-containing protein [Brevibacillus laterosporus]|uniref:DUF5677 domain-containing protein n=1 Tax=Brevibacillus laterosporus TaxID=1465 RepID=UPI00215BD817|nr:DUF5677 domain-containing protein [Brevibacillus laterosporus]MCR8996269.1 DUF5677 domain-containing protein [Brevibacillus laterosporus]